MTAAVDRVLPAGPATAARHPLFIATGQVLQLLHVTLCLLLQVRWLLLAPC